MDTNLWLCPSLPTETLKWLSSLPILMLKSFWRWQCSNRYIISLSHHLHTPFSPSLISRTVSVDVKHHVYLLQLLGFWSWLLLAAWAETETTVFHTTTTEWYTRPALLFRLLSGLCDENTVIQWGTADAEITSRVCCESRTASEVPFFC